jgi:ethanolamine utilization protein EutA
MSPAFPATPGRFTAPARSIAQEDRIVLTSVGIDIGSSTSHLLFSRLRLEREDTRYVTTERTLLYESEILLTPYLEDVTIDQRALGDFIGRQYELAGIDRAAVDTGALILTGAALLRRNARAIAELFALEAGRFVAVSAGDNLEATMAAHGSGAIGLSRSRGAVMNIDIGGGTTKVAVCRDGVATELMTMDVGARLITYDERGVVTRVEEAGREVARRAGVDLAVGRRLRPPELRALAGTMVDALLAQVGPATGHDGSYLLRTGPLRDREGIAAITVSGGVAEFIHDRETRHFGDLGPLLAESLRARGHALPAPITRTPGGIRATVVGASQYTIQVSGSTICVSPMDVLPLRNVPVVMPSFPWDEERLDAAAIERAVRDALARLDLAGGLGPVALAIRWSGSATFARIRAFCTGIVDGMAAHAARGQPLILVFDGDVGGLIGLHLLQETSPAPAVVSIDGVDLREFDYVDIGEMVPTSGAVPVVIKSLVFSTPS